ncbi:hypothetical protein T4D_3325 [Trichinella pseudospiralis]|uniref:Uncharacterized protein n=1 Tax=Trichinella pseudospiralis TaxID=6337 RepID=A0A0V1FAJ1_TRIPS|nr:hypothetical protein T4D_3325 [Trichinella pseudospiralis]
MSLKSSCSLRREAYHGVVNSGQLSKLINGIDAMETAMESADLNTQQDYEQGLKYTKNAHCVYK